MLSRDGRSTPNARGIKKNNNFKTLFENGPSGVLDHLLQKVIIKGYVSEIFPLVKTEPHKARAQCQDRDAAAFQNKIDDKYQSSHVLIENSPWTWGNRPNFHPHTSRMAPA